MTDTNKKRLGSTLWAIAEDLRGAMGAYDFRDKMLSFLFLRYLSRRDLNTSRTSPSGVLSRAYFLKSIWAIPNPARSMPTTKPSSTLMGNSLPNRLIRA